MVLGDLIARLDRPDVAAGVLATLDPAVSESIECRAAALSMSPAEFVAGAVREFMERADDDLWFQLLTHIRKADDPGLVAMQTILRWVVTEK
ncbi:MAG: hypothetical protein WBA42_10200 [Mesorhizobium sp.]